MSFFTRFTWAVFILAVCCLLGVGIAYVFAQSLPPQQQAPVSAEQQLEQCKAQLYDALEANGRSQVFSVQLQRALDQANKKNTEADAKGKAAEKK